MVLRFIMLSDRGGISLIRIENDTCFRGEEPSLVCGEASGYLSIESLRNDNGESFSIVPYFFNEICFLKFCFFFFR